MPEIMLRPSQIYRNAAKLLEDKLQYWSCCAISRASGYAEIYQLNTSPPLESQLLVRRYVLLMCPDGSDELTLSQKMGQLQDEIEDRDHRIMLLCLMAAIVEDEEQKGLVSPV